MKRFNIIFQTLFLIIILCSCTKSGFLDPDPRNRYTQMDAWRSLENTNLYVNGFYVPLYDYGPYGKAYASVGMTDGLTDILKYNSGDMDSYGGDLNKVVFNGMISSSGNPLEGYNYIYNRIRRINEFLEGLDKYTNYSQKDHDLLVAQARFMRAFLYTMLIRNRGSVVLRTRLDGINEAGKARSPENECWDFVMKDLEYAANILPEVWSDPEKNLGRITKGAVYGFMSRAMLYAKRWQLVTEAAQKVTDEGNYSLEALYADAFNKDDNKEAVLAFRFGGKVTQNFDRWYSPSGDIEANPKGIASPTQELVDSYKMADGSKFDWNNPVHAANPYKDREPRFYASILYNGAPWKGRTIETFIGGKDGFIAFETGRHPNTTTTGYYIRKLLDEKLMNLEEKSDKDWVEVRYAEVLLNQAEALVELGKTKEALVPLNKIRARAKLPNVIETDKIALRNIIQEERKVELAFEGHRYWDLRRWNKSVEILKGTKMHGVKITKKNDDSFAYEVVSCDDRERYYEERYDKFPIPLDEIKNNPLCKQIDKW